MLLLCTSKTGVSQPAPSQRADLCCEVTSHVMPFRSVQEEQSAETGLRRSGKAAPDTPKPISSNCYCIRANRGSFSVGRINNVGAGGVHKESVDFLCATPLVRSAVGLINEREQQAENVDETVRFDSCD